MIDIVLFCDLDWGGIWKNIKLSSLSVEWPSQHKSYLQVITEMEMYLLWSLTILSVCVRHCQQKLFTWRYTLQVFNAWDFNRITKVMIQTSRVLNTHRSTERENSWSRFSSVILKDISISLLLLRYSISFRSIYSCSRPFIYT